MSRHCFFFLLAASLAVPGGTAWGFSAFVNLSVTDSFTPATPTGVAAGGVTVMQGPLSADPTFFYNSFLYPGAWYGTMTNITPPTPAASDRAI